MDKLSRKIFQPNILTNTLLDGVCNGRGMNLSDFVNSSITEFFTPINVALKKETDFIFSRILNQEKIEPDELKATLARCVEILKDYPIRDVKPLEEIFIHFTCKRGRVKRYDYIQIVDSLQDDILHHLNDVIKTVDGDFNLGTREFGERSRYIFSHWDELCCYSEIYTALSIIIDCENIYYPLDTFRTIDLIRCLDVNIQRSNLKPIKVPFETHITPKDRYYGIRYEISVYQTDNGYCALSGDVNFEHMSAEIKEYYNHFMRTSTPFGDVTDADIEKIIQLEQEGRHLFKRLKNTR